MILILSNFPGDTITAKQRGRARVKVIFNNIEADFTTTTLDIFVGKSKLDGYVRESANPVTNANVELRDNATNDLVLTATTDGNGYCNFGSVFAGQYKIVIQKAGYEDTDQNIVIDIGR